MLRLSVFKIFILLCAILVLLGGGVAFFFPGMIGLQNNQPQGAITVSPYNTVFKERPNDPGGEKIPYLEYEIYDRLTHNTRQPSELEIVTQKRDQVDFKKVATLYQKNQTINAESNTENNSDSLLDSKPKKNAKFFIQLYASQKKSKVEKAQKKFLKEHSSFFKSQNFMIKSVNIHGKGDFYRLYIGPFVQWDEAKKKCDVFKKNKIDCFVVQP